MSAADIADVFEPSFTAPGVRAAFVPRLPGIDVKTDRATALERLRGGQEEFLRGRGLDPRRMATAEQVHGHGVAVAEEPMRYGGVDALITNCRGLALGIYVADCAAVYLVDRGGRAIGLVHSGRAGTEANIVTATINAMWEHFGIAAKDLAVEISPCIRPPHYEVDFAAHIVEQARAAGVEDIRDVGLCTGSDIERYYSYRREGGRTGRMLAVLALS